MNMWVLGGITWFAMLYGVTGLNLRKSEKNLPRSEKDELIKIRKIMIKFTVIAYLVLGLMLVISPRSIWIAIPLVGTILIGALNIKLTQRSNVLNSYLPKYRRASVYYLVGLIGLGVAWGAPLGFKIN